MKNRPSKFTRAPEDEQMVVLGKAEVFTADGKSLPASGEVSDRTPLTWGPTVAFRKPKLSVDHEVPGLGGKNLGDFWSWAYSDMMSNVNRGVFAEFIVGAALGVLNSAREEWDAVDLRYRDKKIEVKSASYWQGFAQPKGLSLIKFGIAKKKGWDAESNTTAPEPLHSADCYVFALYPEKEERKVNILDIPAWHFYVLRRRTWSSRFRN